MLDKKNVSIFGGSFNNDVIEGTFKVLHQYKSFAFMDGPKTGKIEVLDENNNAMSVWCNEDDFEYLVHEEGAEPTITHTSKSMSDGDLAILITERFSTLERMGHGVVSGHVNSLIVSGSAGIGKTFTLSGIMEHAAETKQVQGYDAYSGSCGAAGLYQALYNFSGVGDVLMLDDMDRIFYDDEAINLLKAALDTGGKRKVSWLKESKWLKENDIPDTFEFKGSVIFITNEDFHRRIQQGGKLAPHMEALISRSCYLDLAIHSARAIMIRVNQVVRESNMLQKKGLSAVQIEQMMEWLVFNSDELLRLDLRTCLKIADFMNMDYSSWQSSARSVLLKPTLKY